MFVITGKTYAYSFLTVRN